MINIQHESMMTEISEIHLLDSYSTVSLSEKVSSLFGKDCKIVMQFQF